MNFFILCLLCIIQGLTEFLPISSSGHLLLLEQLFGVEGDLLFLNLFLHLATLCAVVIVYFSTIKKILKKPFQKYNLKIIISTIVTCLFAFGYKFLNLDSVATKIYCFGFLLTSIMLYASYVFNKKTVHFRTGEISYFSSIAVGIVQGFAVIPGLSRSGSTISIMQLLGYDEDCAAEYSFVLSMPIIIGGFIIELFEQKTIISPISNIKMYIFAFFLTFFTALISLKITLKLLKNKKFNWFSIYTFVLFIIIFVINYII